MAQLSKANIETIKNAVKEGLISSGIAVAFYEKSAKNQTSIRDLQFILDLMKMLISSNKKIKQLK